MNKTLPGWAYGVLAVVGAVLVGSMVLDWIDISGFGMRGISLAWDANHWLFLVPVAGVALAAAAITRSSHTRLAALAAGVLITGYVLFDVARSLISSSVDTWMILGGAGIMLAGIPKERSLWRAAGGIAVIVGFFAPWADFSMWKLLTSDAMSMAGLSYKLLWLVPVAGVTGVISAGNAVTGAKLAAASGVAIYGVFLWIIGSLAWAVFGLGAWAALGASAVALVIGVLARAPVVAAAVVKPTAPAAKA